MTALPTKDPHAIGITMAHSYGTNVYQNIRSTKVAAWKAKATIQEYQGSTQKSQRQHGSSKHASTFRPLLCLKY